MFFLWNSGDHGVDEEWAYIDGFPEYSVSDFGRVANLKFDRVLKTQLTDRGYKKVVLQSRDNGSQQFYVHQLVAAAFLADFRPGLRVTHRDLDRTNNKVPNLRILKGEYKGELIYDSPRMHARRLRIVETGEVFRTAYDCARHIGGRASNIYRVINGYRDSHLGYTFEYVDTDVNTKFPTQRTPSGAEYF